MAIKTQPQILQDMSADFLANQSKVTYLGPDGVARAILASVSNISAEIWNDLIQSIRKAFVETAEGADLDTLGNRMGLARGSASKSSVPVLINGPTGTVISTGTIIKSNISGVQYQTKSDITLGTNNPSLVRPLSSSILGDVVTAESIDTGSKTSVNVNELTQLQTPITGVTVTNLVPSSGGVDAEDDVQYRIRILNQIAILNQGTKKFYQALAQAADNTVYSSRAIFDPTNLGTKIYLVKNSFASYNSGELVTIQNYIYDNQRALSPVTCLNATKRGIDIYVPFTRDPKVLFSTILSNMASQIANYIQDIFDFGAKIVYDEVLDIVLNINGILNVDTTKFTMNLGQEDVVCDALEVPKFTSLNITDGDQTQNVTLTSTY